MVCYFKQCTGDGRLARYHRAVLDSVPRVGEVVYMPGADQGHRVEEVVYRLTPTRGRIIAEVVLERVG